MSQQNTSESESTETQKETSVETPGSSPLETTAEPVATLSEVVAQSQEQMQEAPAPVKSRGGRPKGSKTKNRTAAPGASTSTENVQAPPAEQVSLAPMLGMVAGLPYQIAATRTGFEGFKLNAEEALAIGGSLDAVVQKYFPQLSEKAGVGVMAAFTIVSVTLAKVMAYEAWKQQVMATIAKQRAEAAGQTELKTEPSPEATFTGNPFVSKL